MGRQVLEAADTVDCSNSAAAMMGPLGTLQREEEGVVPKAVKVLLGILVGSLLEWWVTVTLTMITMVVEVVVLMVEMTQSSTTAMVLQVVMTLQGAVKVIVLVIEVVIVDCLRPRQPLLVEVH